MGDIEILLLKVAVKGLVENLSRNGIGMADLLEDGAHYYLGGQEYLITCKRVEDDEYQNKRSPAPETGREHPEARD